MSIFLTAVLLSRTLGLGQATLGVPAAPTEAPQSVPSSATTSSLELTWPRGDDATVEHPVEWFELQQRRLGTEGSGAGDEGWETVAGGDRVGAPASPRREGQHEVQVVSVRADRGQQVQLRYSAFFFAPCAPTTPPNRRPSTPKLLAHDCAPQVNGGFFQLSFSLGGANDRERYTDAAHATNKTSVTTAPIPWDASAASVKAALEALETVQRVQVCPPPPPTGAPSATRAGCGASSRRFAARCAGGALVPSRPGRAGRSGRRVHAHPLPLHPSPPHLHLLSTLVCLPRCGGATRRAAWAGPGAGSGAAPTASAGASPGRWSSSPPTTRASARPRTGPTSPTGERECLPSPSSPLLAEERRDLAAPCPAVALREHRGRVARRNSVDDEAALISRALPPFFSPHPLPSTPTRFPRRARTGHRYVDEAPLSLRRKHSRASGPGEAQATAAGGALENAGWHPSEALTVLEVWRPPPRAAGRGRARRWRLCVFCA